MYILQMKVCIKDPKDASQKLNRADQSLYAGEMRLNDPLMEEDNWGPRTIRTRNSCKQGESEQATEESMLCVLLNILSLWMN